MQGISEFVLVLQGNRLQLFAVVVSVLFFLFVVRLVKRKHIQVEYSLLWLGFACLFVVMSLFRDLIEWFAGILGIAYAPSALLLVLVVATICILIQFSIVLSKLSDRCRILTQELAILRRQFDEHNERQVTKGKK